MCEFERLVLGFQVFRCQFEIHLEILMQLKARLCAAAA
jgi:hypothetical protein